MDAISSILTAILLAIGVFLMLVAGYGIVRLPSTLTRMAATTKASTMAAAALLLAAYFHFGDLRVLIQVIITLGFLFVTAPVGAHIIGRSGFKTSQYQPYPLEIDDLTPYYEKQEETDND